MGVRRYEMSLQVPNSISHKYAQQASEIYSWTQEEIFHINKQPYIVLCRHTDNHLFDDFLKKKIVGSPSECFCTISENFERLPMNSEDDQMFLGRFEWFKNQLKQFVTFELFRLHVLWKSLPLVQLTIWLCFIPRVWMTCHLMYVKQLLMPSLSYTGLLLLVTHTCRACKVNSSQFYLQCILGLNADQDYGVVSVDKESTNWCLSQFL